MLADYTVADGNELAVWTFDALMLAFVAEPPHPLVSASRAIATPAAFVTFKTHGVNIVATSKQRSEQLYLVVGSRKSVYFSVHFIIESVAFTYPIPIVNAIICKTNLQCNYG